MFLALLGILCAIKSNSEIVRSNELAMKDSCRSYQTNPFLHNTTLCQPLRQAHDYDLKSKRWLQFNVLSFSQRMINCFEESQVSIVEISLG
ncbi:hypothetical protein B0J11DRAFT_301469 [Dendryphion nanum]|uniref:Secreted protein n=1 Tax=Dendryphion nanum TaxID=256645 RepID=A0A9P9DUK0_9PLEO|nr:hypothetical protein B0J11DRAFT_301469 [Dendryphion nanum]